MINILSKEVLDIIPIEIGFIAAVAEKDLNGEDKLATYVYDQDGERLLPLKIPMYLEFKFGKNGKIIAKSLENPLFCTSVILKSGGVVVLSKDGKLVFFDSEGKIIKNKELRYLDSPARDLLVDGPFFWSAVPEQNAIIKYSPVEDKVVLRIGGGISQAFNKPTAIQRAKNTLYVCNSGTNTIRTIKTDTYTVKDYMTFDEKIYKFFFVGNKEYAHLKSGVYWVNDDKR